MKILEFEVKKGERLQFPSQLYESPWCLITTVSNAPKMTASPSKSAQIPLAKQKLPPPKLQLQLEIEAYQRQIAKLEKDKKNAADEALISIALNEVQTRKVLYDTLVGMKYASPSEVFNRIEKQALVRLFLGFHGHAWARNAGWVGQPKVLKKPETLLFEGESSVFEGVELSDVGLNQKVVNVVTTLNLEGSTKVRRCVGGINMLVFSGNGCIGTMASEVCNLGSLQNLYLQHNLISGNIPSQFSKLQSLKRLRWVLLCYQSFTYF